MVNGLPGNMATCVALHVSQDNRFSLLPYSLTGPEICQKEHMINQLNIQLLDLREREIKIPELIKEQGQFIIIDYTHPSAVNENMEFYIRHSIPFVMGTTGGDLSLLNRMLSESSISAVIAPNMAKQIVGFQAMMAYAAETFPGLFSGYHLEIKESHQHMKADTSGTARMMVSFFNQLGIPFTESQIIKERNPDTQKNILGVPDSYINAHAWHTYTLLSKDQSARFEFTHNINGRDIYVQGTLDAVDFLAAKINSGSKGHIYSMIDVLKDHKT